MPFSGAPTEPDPYAAPPLWWPLLAPYVRVLIVAALKRGKHPVTWPTGKL